MKTVIEDTNNQNQALALVPAAVSKVVQPKPTKKEIVAALVALRIEELKAEREALEKKKPALLKKANAVMVRRDKETERRKWSAWDDLCIVIDRTCTGCGFLFSPPIFWENAELTGRGHIKHLACPKCRKHLIGLPYEQ